MVANKKPNHKYTIPEILVGLVLFAALFGGLVGAVSGSSDVSTDETISSEKIEPNRMEVTQQPEIEVTQQPEIEVTQQPESENSANETTGQINARKSAKNYLDYTAFSRSGLINQLEYEGFTTEEATYGVDSLNTDWNEQAVKAAKNYLDYTAFSRSGLINQLEYEGFSTEEATYGVSANGY